MSDSEGTVVPDVTVVFADLCDSTNLYARLGNEEAFRVASECLDVMDAATRERGGRVIKRLGDGLLAAFESASAATDAATKMIAGIRGVRTSQGQIQQIHIGISRGGVLLGDDDVHGDVVNVASRLSALAAPGEILITHEVLAALSPGHERATQPLEGVRVRSHPGGVRIYRYLTDTSGGDDTTIQAPLFGKAPRTTLELTYRDAVVCVDPSKPMVSLGRDRENDVVVLGSVVSRRHAEIACIGRVFTLRDLSTNGTYILGPGGDLTVRVNRDTHVLAGEGYIGLGQSDALDAVHFRFIDAD